MQPDSTLNQHQKKNKRVFWVGLPFIHKKTSQPPTHPIHHNPSNPQQSTSAMRGTFCRAWTLRTLQPWPWRMESGPVDRWIGGLVDWWIGWDRVDGGSIFGHLSTPVFVSSQKVGWGPVFFGEFFLGGDWIGCEKKLEH